MIRCLVIYCRWENRQILTRSITCLIYMIFSYLYYRFASRKVYRIYLAIGKNVQWKPDTTNCNINKSSQRSERCHVSPSNSKIWVGKKAWTEVRKPRYFEVPLHKRLRKKLTAGEKLPVELSWNWVVWVWDWLDVLCHEILSIYGHTRYGFINSWKRTPHIRLQHFLYL